MLDKDRIGKYVNESIMLVTALTSVIGYDKAAAIAHKAFKENLTLRDAAISTGCITEKDYDRVVVPENMVGNPDRDLETLQN
jgi:fumarate hydratase class II